mmetsp:Transcript_4646/g.9340  ORF Transcript_4646/g.9340 Transcript_4646/m.9340 type:complete len:137 (+) Transcript_4646:117-527(+)
MEALPESFLSVFRGIQRFEEAVTQMVAPVREKRRVLVNVVCRDLRIPPPPADFSLPPATFEKASPPPPPRVAAALTGLSEVVDTTLQYLKQETHSKLDQILNEYHKIDLSPLFASKVGNVIRSFQAVDAETLRQAA